jgi:hypothetical protein
VRRPGGRRFPAIRFVSEAAVEIREKVTFARAAACGDRVGRALENGLPHRARVEQIEHDRLRTECSDPFCVFG